MKLSTISAVCVAVGLAFSAQAHSENAKPWYSIMHYDGDCGRIDNPAFVPDKLIVSMRGVGGDAVDITDPNDGSWPEFFVRLPSGRVDGLIFIQGETECTVLAAAMRIVKRMPYQERMDDPNQPGRKG